MWSGACKAAEASFPCFFSPQALLENFLRGRGAKPWYFTALEAPRRNSIAAVGFRFWESSNVEGGGYFTWLGEIFLRNFLPYPPPPANIPGLKGGVRQTVSHCQGLHQFAAKSQLHHPPVWSAARGCRQPITTDKGWIFHAEWVRWNLVKLCENHFFAAFMLQSLPGPARLR